MDEDQNGPNAPLNADDFVDRPPNREECRRLLDEANGDGPDGDAEKVEAWNRMRERFRESGWRPDISDQDDPWRTINYNYNPAHGIAIDFSLADLAGAHLADMRMRGADLSNANLRGAILNEAKLDGAKIRDANMMGCHLLWASFSEANIVNTQFSTPYGTELSEQVIAKFGSHGPSFSGAHLSRVVFGPADLQVVNFHKATLTAVDFEGAELERCDFTESRLGNVNFRNTTMESVNFTRARITYSNFDGSVLSSVSLGTLPGWKISALISKRLKLFRDRVKHRIHKFEKNNGWCARFYKSIVSGSSIESSYGTCDANTDWLGTDLRTANGFVPNGQRIKDARFAANAKDPYSIVRRKYTGPLMLFNLVFLAVFFTPYIIRAGAWTAYDRAQQTEIGQVYITEGPGAARRALWEQSLDSVGIHDAIESVQADLRAQVPPAFIEHLVAWEAARALEVMESAPDTEREKIIQDDNIETRERSVLMIVLGFEPGFFGTLAGCLSIVFVLYNVLRGVVTWWLSQVRDAEERSGHLPDIRQYWWCYSLHHYFLRYVYWFAVGAFMLNMSRWALTTVSVPI